MGAWTDAVEAKARIIHGQMLAARTLANSNGAAPDGVERPYLDLLNELYRNEFLFAQLVDSSDLVARFEGPALSGRDPTISIVTWMFSSLRKQIQGIAKSIAGLESDERVRWPMEFEPQLSGIAPGSLVVGLRIQSPDADTSKAQTSIPSLSEPVVQAIRQAVKDIASIGRYVHEEGVDDSIAEAFPDPAVRDALMVAASKLAPTGRRGVEALAFYRPDTNDAEARPLTPRSRKVLNSAVKRPVRASGSGSFVGIVRAIDLDARRFEIRHVQDIGAIRCVYAKNVEESVRKILDTRVRVTGQYETLPNRKPRLINVSSMEIFVEPTQKSMPLQH